MRIDWKFMKKRKAIPLMLTVALIASVGVAAGCKKKKSEPAHEHTFATEWSKDDVGHWYGATCEHTDEKSGYAEHEYDNACDTKCNVCDAERETEHAYDNACDTKCNVCDAEREIEHAYGEEMVASKTYHWYECTVCGDKKDEAEHEFTLELAVEKALKEAATPTTKAQYWKSCACGAVSTTVFFETDKTVATLANIQDLSKTYDKVELADPTYETNSDGEVTIEWYQGETKLDARPITAGTYKVKVTIAESETFTGVSGEQEFTIAKRIMWTTDAKFAYNSFDNFYGDAAKNTFEFYGLVDSDVLDASDVWFKFDGATVDNTLIGVYFDGAGAEFTDNYEFDITGCDAEIVPKTLNNLNLTKVYDGYWGFGDNANLECPLGAEHGVVAGDTVFLETNDDVEYHVGSYFISGGTIKGDGTDDSVFLYGEDSKNYKLCSDANGYSGKITVTPRPVWITDVSYTYSGNAYYSDEESVTERTIHNTANKDDEAKLSGCFNMYFQNANAGARLTEIRLGGDVKNDYSVDFSKCEAQIIKREIWVTDANFDYDGNATQSDGQSNGVNTYHNFVSQQDEATIEGNWTFTFESMNVGAKLVNVTIPDYVTNYTVNVSKCSASIVKRELWVTGATFIYDGWDRLCDDESITERTIYNAANKDDEWYMGGYFTFIFENSNAGAQLQGVELSYPDLKDNYEINVSKCEAKIVSKEIEVPTTASFEYEKNDNKHDIVFENVRSNEFLALKIYFRDDAVGASKYAIEHSIYYSDNALSVKTKDEMLNNYSPKGYTDWDAYKEAIYAVAEITPRLIDLPQEQITKVYDQTANFNYDYTVAATHDWLNISFKVVDAENNALNQAGEYAGVNVQDVVISINGGLETDNYALRATEGVANVKITPIVLDVKDLYFNYPPSYYYNSIEIPLGTSVGVLEGDIARLYINFGNTKPNNNSDISLEDATSIHIYAENNAKTNKNYVLPEDISAITLHTSTFETIAVDASTLEGFKSFGSTLSKKGVFAVTLPEDGSYNFTCTAENTSNIYDGNGNKMIIGDNSTYVGLKAGTYYWHYSISSNFINVKFMVTKVVAKGEKNNPKIIAFNTDTKIAEDKNLDWHGLDEYWYKVSLQVGWYSVGQKGLKVSVLDGSWNTYATLVGEFQITSAGQYLIYINKADNAEIYDTVTRFSLVSHSISDNAETMYEDPGAQGVFISDDYTLSEDNHIFFFDYDPYWNITKTIWFALVVYDGTSWDNVIASYKFYDSDHKEVNISWDGEELSFPSGYSEEDQLYLVVTFREAAYGKTIYLQAY